MDFAQEYNRRAEAFEKILTEHLIPGDGFSASLAWAANYSLKAGGKRLRPILLLEAFSLFSGTDAFAGQGSGEDASRRAAEHFAVALECVHTHSLVHDDLPALDDDALRRGKPTTHAAFGEAAAVLAGDLLLNYAYENAATAVCLEKENAPTALRVLAEKTGLAGMLGGQGEDVKNEKQGGAQLSRGELDEIYLHKTSALIEAALVIGGALGGAGREEQERLEKLGTSLGLAFQIRDDILDVTSDSATLGKPTRSDEKNEKTTYVTLLGTDGAEAEVERLSGEALLFACALPGDTGFLKELVKQLAGRSA